MQGAVCDEGDVSDRLSGSRHVAKFSAEGVRMIIDMVNIVDIIFTCPLVEVVTK